MKTAFDLAGDYGVPDNEGILIPVRLNGPIARHEEVLRAPMARARRSYSPR